MKLGAKKDGTLVAGQMKVVVDIGAHNTQAYSLLGCMAGWWVSLYRLPHLQYEGKAVYTNKVPACAMQGFGNPQVNFAVESMMDMLAEKLGIDPIELRLKNYVGLGETFWGQGPTVQSIIRSCGVEEMLTEGPKLIGWERRKRRLDEKGPIRRGIGMARGFHTSGAGAPLPGEVIDYSGAIVKINEDGSVDFLTALMDLGGGTLDALAKIVAEELKVPCARSASLLWTRVPRSTMFVRMPPVESIVEAEPFTRSRVRRKKNSSIWPAGFCRRLPPSLKMEVDEEAGQGVIYVDGVPDKRVTIGEVAKTAQLNDWGTIAAVDSLRQVSCPPCFMAHFLEVEVNTETGVIRPVRAVIYADVGQVINPDLADGQMFGGLYRGLGYALIEDTQYDQETGDLTSKG